LISGRPASAQYTIFDYPYTPFGVVSQTNATAINSPGQIVGSYEDIYGTHGFLLSQGVYSQLDEPNASYTVRGGATGDWGTFPSGINSQGQVVGNYVNERWWDPNFGFHGFVLSHGVYTSLDDPSGIGQTFASSINDHGDVVGTYFGGGTHGFLLSKGVYTNIDYPYGVGYVSTYASAINNRGDIVGYYTDDLGDHGFLLSKGVFTPIGDPAASVLGESATQALGINDSGQIVGWYVDPSFTGHSFLFSHGVYTELDVPNAYQYVGTYASGINAQGQIVGTYYDASQAIHGFLFSPQPSQ
jgi:probable HAF family extracellular repeat protein